MNGPATRIAIAVVERDDRFLIGRRPPGVPLAGFWEFPGGKVREGEAPADAAARECLEEAGICVRVGMLQVAHTQQYEHGRLRLEFFACRPNECPNDCNPAPRPPFRWVPRERLADHTFPAGNQCVLELLLGAG